MTIGSTVSHYRITSQLGAGGMGQVYRATDSRLSRDVAIKILPPTQDESLHQRFTQEARAASALNHPNIVGVYDVGSQEGTPYIVSELVEGESLRDLIARGPVPVRKLLDLATQIADGIAAAHAAGIAHRDLKPENIMITREGRAKILDFGLAKQQAGSAPMSAEEATVAMSQTQPGMIMGTANYMSPEQAKGIASDHRSDQFSFGVVLYEMVTGKQPFQRETTVQTLAAVLTDDPAPIAPDAKVPAPLRWIINRCLEKDPKQRYGSSHDLYHDLKNLRDHASEITSVSGMTAAMPMAPPKKTGNPWRLIALVAPAVALAAGYAFSRYTMPDATDISHHRFTPIATEAVNEVNVSWSPDGKSVVYAAPVDGNNQIFLRNLGSPMPVQLTRMDKWCRNAFWHPKEPRVFFQAGGALYSVAIAGGEPEKVLPSVSTAAISPDGSVLVVMQIDPNKLKAGEVAISSPPGSPPKPYKPAPFAGGTYYGDALLQFSPDGKKIYFGIKHPKGAPESWLLPWPNDGKENPQRIWTSITGLIPAFSWWPDSRRAIIQLSSGYSDGHIWLADTKAGLVHAITTGLGSEAGPSLSSDGMKIAYTDGKEDFDIVDVPLSEEPVRKMVATGRREASAVWAPSGNQFAFLTDRGGSWEIWLKSKQEGWERPIVQPKDFSDTTNAVMTSLAFSPDGGRIAFTRSLIDRNSIWISPVSGGAPVPLTSDDGAGQFGATWSPDGNWIAYLQVNGDSLRIVKSRVGGREAPVNLSAQIQDMLLSNPRWSPKGDWITVNTQKGSGVVSADGKTVRMLDKEYYQRTAWSPDGKTIYGMRVLKGETLLSAIDSETGTGKELRRLGSEYYFQEPIDIGATFSLAPDGKSVLMSTKRVMNDIWMLEGFHHP